MATRRQFFSLAAAAGAVAGLAACGNGGAAPAGDGSAKLRVSWWGNPLRNENTTKAAELYTETNPKVTFELEPGDWSSYWERLSTQTAAQDAPDVVQMDTTYIAEYGNRGALSDLSAVDTSAFGNGVLDLGKIEGQQVAIPLGTTTPSMVANPAVFEKAGVEIPDDMTWTWDTYREVAAEVTAKTDDGIYGAEGTFAIPGCVSVFTAWLRGQGMELYSPEGTLGFTADDITPYFDMVLKFRDDKAIASAAAISEAAGQALAQSPFAQGKEGLSWWSTSQFAAISEATGNDLQIMRFPSFSGDAKDRGTWVGIATWWAVPSTGDQQDAAADFVNWWVNSIEVGEISLAERGLPPNTEVLAAITDQLDDKAKVSAQFMQDIQDEFGGPVAPSPAGSGNTEPTLMRHTTDLLFDKSNAADTAKGFVDEVLSSLQR